MGVREINALRGRFHLALRIGQRQSGGRLRPTDEVPCRRTTVWRAYVDRKVWRSKLPQRALEATTMRELVHGGGSNCHARLATTLLTTRNDMMTNAGGYQEQTAQETVATR